MVGERIHRERGCGRAREWASLRADGELSELERLLLRRHLARCESCRAFAETLTETTRLLRTAPLEHPSRSLVPEARPVRLQRPRYRLALAATFVAFAAAAGGLIGGILGQGDREGPTPAPPDIALRPDEGTTGPTPTATSGNV